MRLAALASDLARICHRVLNDMNQSGGTGGLRAWAREKVSSEEGMALPQPGSASENTAALLNGTRGGWHATGGRDGERHLQVALQVPVATTGPDQGLGQLSPPLPLETETVRGPTEEPEGIPWLSLA